MNFPGGSICSSNRHEFSRRVYMFFKQTQIFQEGLSKRHVFLRRLYLFVEQTLLFHRTDTHFPRNPYLVLEHILIFQGASIFSSNRYSFSRKPYLVLEHIQFSRRSLPSGQKDVLNTSKRRIFIRRKDVLIPSKMSAF